MTCYGREWSPRSSWRIRTARIEEGLTRLKDALGRAHENRDGLEPASATALGLRGEVLASRSRDPVRARRVSSGCLPRSGSREETQGPPDPYPQMFGPARCTPPCVSHQCRTACCEGPDSEHTPFAYSPPAREQIAAESAQAATDRVVTTRAAPIPVTALAHFLSTEGCDTEPELYRSVITRRIEPEFRSSSTSPPRTSLGDPGKVLIWRTRSDARPETSWSGRRGTSAQRLRTA